MRADAAPDDADPHSVPRVERLDTPDGRHLTGTLRGEGPSGLRFEPAEGAPPVTLGPGSAVVFEPLATASAAATPPFHAELGLGQRISGRLGGVGDADVTLEDGPGHEAVRLVRGGVLALRQRPGEVQVFQDGFEALDPRTWKSVGDPSLADEPRLVGGHSLRLPAGGSGVTYRIPDPIGSGRLEVAFHDDGRVVPGHRWFVDLKFRGPAGDEWVRALLGWDEDTLAVQTSPDGPALPVQRLARRPGWHRLIVRFGPERTDLTVDGFALAHGHAPPGPLLELRLASETLAGAGAPPEGLAAFADDLRLARVVEPVGGLATDPEQDEVRLVGGDQLFGAIRRADPDRVTLAISGRDATFPWAEVAGLHFRRAAPPAAEIRGLWARMEWWATPGNDLRDLDSAEGALAAAGPDAFALATPYAGTLTISRDRLRRITILGPMRRRVLDPTSHHLGNNVVRDLEPPQPEGRRLTLAFDLDAPPADPATLAVDVVQVAGEAEPLEFAAAVKDGELRTDVRVNGRSIDYLNRQIASQNETPERLHLAIPAGLLVAGPNRVEFEGGGRKSDPEDLDDIGILGIALESGLEGGPPAAVPAPVPRR